MVAVVNSVYGGLGSIGGIAAAPATPVNGVGLAGGGGQSISNYLPPVGGGFANFIGALGIGAIGGLGGANPPQGFGGGIGNFGNGDAGPPNIGPLPLQNIGAVPPQFGGTYMPPPQYIVEQFTNTVTGQSWYVPRATNNVNDGMLPTDQAFQQQFKTFGANKFKKVIANQFQTSSDLIKHQATLNTIVKNTQSNAKANNQKYLPPIIANPSLGTYA
jgi:hypothetical protein